MDEGRILALDYGHRRIGVAVSDPLRVIAQPVATWCGLSDTEAVEKIGSLVNELGVGKIIVGNPLTLKGQKSDSTRIVEKFVARLSRQISIPVKMWDERFTTVLAQRILRQMNEKPSREKGRIDLIASAVLLQNYLDNLNMTPVDVQ